MRQSPDQAHGTAAISRSAVQPTVQESTLSCAANPAAGRSGRHGDTAPRNAGHRDRWSGPRVQHLRWHRPRALHGHGPDPQRAERDAIASGLARSAGRESVVQRRGGTRGPTRQPERARCSWRWQARKNGQVSRGGERLGTVIRQIDGPVDEGFIAFTRVSELLRHVRRKCLDSRDHARRCAPRPESPPKMESGISRIPGNFSGSGFRRNPRTDRARCPE